jgi:hypothetical protein
MDENMIKYCLKIFIIGLLFFALTSIIINTLGINLNIEEHPKKLIQVITMEAFQKQEKEKEKGQDQKGNISSGADAFCQSYKGNSGNLNTACGNLTNKNCNATSCCILTSDQKCVAGNADGATYNTDSNGKTINLDYYYYQNKCYGDKCPNKIKKMIMLKTIKNKQE